MNGVYLGIGGNVGNRAYYLDKARAKITGLIGPILRESSIYKTAAWGNTEQQDFYNQVLYVRTKLEPASLLKTCLEIEKEMGRQRDVKWSARTIDIDILFFNNTIIQKERLQIPHPHAHLRNFVLIPMEEIAPHYIHPIFRKKIRTLLKQCPDILPVSKV